MVTSGLARSYLVSGWCGRCGCKRSQDGDCPNCDKWYTHPLLMVGGPLIFSLVLLMFIGIHSLRDADPGFARWENSLISSGPQGRVTATTMSSVPQATVPVRSTPTYFTPAIPSPAVSSAPTPRVLPIEGEFAQLEMLRDTAHTAERAYRVSTGEIPGSAGSTGAPAASAGPGVRLRRALPQQMRGVSAL